MSTDKDPDFGAIARKVASKEYPSLEDFDAEAGFASCMEARLRSDWETIRLLRTLEHGEKCGHELPFSPPLECTCGLSAHLSKLLEPFTP